VSKTFLDPLGASEDSAKANLLFAQVSYSMEKPTFLATKKLEIITVNASSCNCNKWNFFFNDSIINKNLQFWVDKSFLMKYPIYYYIIT
jgi:hypothetical protein